MIDDAPVVLRTLALTYGDGHGIEPHSHRWSQLIYAATGTMRVSTQDSCWLVPPTRAIWAPAGVVHQIRFQGTTAIRTLYVAPHLTLNTQRTCRALEVSPLLRELILHIVGVGMLRSDVPAQQRMQALLLDLLDASTTSPLALPLPRDKRARRVAEQVLADPGSPATLTELAHSVGASTRTLQRCFPEETGLSFHLWRQRARLQHGLAQLVSGVSVSGAALDAGYASVSAFVAAFRQHFGVTPGRYKPRGVHGSPL